MIKDVTLISPISEMLLTMQDAAQQILIFLSNNNQQNFEIVSQDLFTALTQIEQIAKPFQKEDEHIRLSDACSCAKDSLIRIRFISKRNLEMAIQKVEFELIPILKITYIQFRYWGCTYPDEQKLQLFRDKEVPNFILNPYLEEAKEKKQYKYELSIFVTAYNKLNYTKVCIENLLKWLPKDLNYELILLNHGSKDGTKEYFESIAPTKQIDILINGAVPYVVFTVLEGKYCISISNDVVITPNAIQNIYRTLKETKNVGWVVPSTPNVSNLQTISAKYSSPDELALFTDVNNQYNSRRHERRTRLCNPITGFCLETQMKIIQKYLIELCFSSSNAFPDDRFSLFYRRNGYKLLLAKDAYCHHFGQVTIKDEITVQNQEKIYNQGRAQFYNQFGIDPWGIGFCYDYEMVDCLPCNDILPVKVMGINCGQGSNSLKIKEKIREITGNTQVTLLNTTNNKSFYMDLQGVSDKTLLFDCLDSLYQQVKEFLPDYIIIDAPIDNIVKEEYVLKSLLRLLKKKAIICLKLNRKQKININQHEFEFKKSVGNWLIIKK